MKIRRSRRTLALSALCVSAVFLVGFGLRWYHTAAANSFSSCASYSDYNHRYNCWEKVLTRELATKDVSYELAQLRSHLAESPEFVKSCHSFAHQIGESAYRQFAAGEPMQSSPDTQVCDFGFYHGFMTEFLADSREYVQLGAFCGSIKDSNVNGQLVSSRWACFHGIGHGSVSEYGAAAWANGTLKPLTDTIAICKTAAQTDQDYQRCVEGAYNGMSYGVYKDVLDPHDPYKICRQVPANALPEACYTNLASDVFILTKDWTIRQALEAASAYTPRQYLPATIETFANMASRKLSMASDFTCPELPQDEASACLSGFVSGLVQLEPPESKEKGAFELCSSNLLPDGWRAPCFVATLSILPQFWSPDRVASACDLAPREYKDTCRAAQSPVQRAE